VDLDAQIARAEEPMCADILSTAKLDIIDWDDQQKLLEVDFGPLNYVGIDPAEYWDVTGAQSADPFIHLEAMKRLVNAAGFPANYFVLGADAATAFLRNVNVREGSNFLNYRKSAIDVKTYTDYTNFGVTNIGEYMKLQIWSYDAMYENSYNNKMHFYWPLIWC
jgi:hypothetical protein